MGALQLLLTVSINNIIMVIFIHIFLPISLSSSQIRIRDLIFLKFLIQITNLLSKKVITLHVPFICFHEADMLELSG